MHTTRAQSGRPGLLGQQLLKLCHPPKTQSPGLHGQEQGSHAIAGCGSACASPTHHQARTFPQAASCLLPQYGTAAPRMQEIQVQRRRTRAFSTRCLPPLSHHTAPTGSAGRGPSPQGKVCSTAPARTCCCLRWARRALRDSWCFCRAAASSGVLATCAWYSTRPSHSPSSIFTICTSRCVGRGTGGRAVDHEMLAGL